MNNKVDYSKFEDFKAKCQELAEVISELDCPKLSGYEEKIKTASDEKIAKQIQVFEGRLEEVYKTVYALFVKDVLQMHRALTLLHQNYSKSQAHIYKNKVSKEESAEVESEFEEITGVHFEIEPRHVESK